MARTSNTFRLGSPAALEAALDAWFATLVNPAIRGIDFQYRNQSRVLGLELVVGVDYDTGGPSLATAFTSKCFVSPSGTTLDADVNAFVALNPGWFYAIRHSYFDGDAGPLTPRFAALVIANVTAGATANWILY